MTIKPFLLLVFMTSLFSVCMFISTSAQQLNVIIDKDSILLGQQVKLIITIDLPKSYQSVIFPEFENTDMSERIEIITINDTDTIRKEKDWIQLLKSLTITSFDTGLIYITPLHFGFIRDNQSEPLFFKSDSLFLMVEMIDVDTSMEIMDIRNLWNIPTHWKEYIPFIKIGSILLVIFFISFFLYLRRIKGLSLFQAKSEYMLSPHEEALTAFNKIEEDKLWQSGLIKDYYTSLTDIIRRYIERRFQIKANELSTDEILKAFPKVCQSKDSAEQLKYLLHVAGMVKFARNIPGEAENEHCLNLAIEFVNLTTPAAKESDHGDKIDIIKNSEI